MSLASSGSAPVVWLMSGNAVQLKDAPKSCLDIKEAVAGSLQLYIDDLSYISVYKRDPTGSWSILGHTESVDGLSMHETLHAVIRQKPLLQRRYHGLYRYRGTQYGLLSRDGCVYWAPSRDMCLRLTPDGEMEEIKIYEPIDGDADSVRIDEWTGGAVLPSTGDIYFAPDQHNRVLRIQPGGIASLVGPTIGPPELPQYPLRHLYQADGCVAMDGSIFFAPCMWDMVLHITSNGEVRLSPIPDELKSPYPNKQFMVPGVLSPNGTIYVAPHHSKGVLCIRPDGAIESKMLDVLMQTMCRWTFNGAVAAVDNCIYFAPKYGPFVLQITMADEINTIDISDGHDDGEGYCYVSTYCCRGFAFKDGRVYFAPTRSDVFLVCGNGVRTWCIANCPLDISFAAVAPVSGNIVCLLQDGLEAKVMQIMPDGAFAYMHIALKDYPRRLVGPPVVVENRLIFGPSLSPYGLELVV